jgi:proline iminopeptidase
MFAAVRGTLIYFDVEGMGLVPDGPTMRERPVAMVIHGGPGGDHSGFKPSFSPLADRMQLVYFDHRGQGRSAAADPATYTLNENVEDMEALRRHLGLGSIVSIGTSYGGMVAMAHAARYPDAVSHLILVVTAAHGGFIPRAQAILRERGTAEQQAVCETLWAGAFRSAEDMQLYYRVMGPMYARQYDAAAGALGRERAIYSPEPLNRAFGPEGFLRRFDLRGELGRITAPTLIMAGRHDWICPVEFSEEIHHLIQASDLRVFEHSSHSIRSDEPEALMDAILGFVVYNTDRSNR